MIFITQLIYILDQQESVFDEFERLAIPIITKYNGRLLFRVRPGQNNFIDCNTDQPYEIHLAEFETDQDFENYMQDEDRKSLLYLKEKSIKSVFFIKGRQLHALQ
jgi:uncharacterized protein (DUF1330 family)